MQWRNTNLARILVSSMIVASILSSIWYEYMLVVMGIMLLCLGGLKLLDLKGFATLFQQYDAFAQYSSVYAKAVPFLELGLGICFLANVAVIPAAIILAVMRLESFVSGLRVILRKQRVRCACMGAGFTIEVGKLTLLEDAVMFFMALMVFML